MKKNKLFKTFPILAIFRPSLKVEEEYAREAIRKIYSDQSCINKRLYLLKQQIECAVKRVNRLNADGKTPEADQEMRDAVNRLNFLQEAWEQLQTVYKSAIAKSASNTQSFPLLVYNGDYLGNVSRDFSAQVRSDKMLNTYEKTFYVDKWVAALCKTLEIETEEK